MRLVRERLQVQGGALDGPAGKAPRARLVPRRAVQRARVRVRFGLTVLIRFLMHEHP